MKTDIDRDEYRDPHGGRTPFGEWLESHETTKLHRGRSTEARDRSLIRKHVSPHFSDKRLSQIKPIQVHEWVAGLDDAGLSPDTIRKAHRLLRSALDAAVDDGLIGSNPAARVSLPTIEQRERRFLTVPETETLAGAIDYRYRAFVLAAAYTGLRFGELAGLTTPHLNLLRRQLRVEQAATEVRGVITIDGPKSEASRRTIALSRGVVDRLGAHMAEFPPNADGFVFTTRHGFLIRNSNFRHRHWNPAVARSIGGHLRFHDLRHTHAALLVAEGVHPKVIQARLGHKSIKTTLDLYGHLYEGADQGAAEAIERAINA